LRRSRAHLLRKKGLDGFDSLIYGTAELHLKGIADLRTMCVKNRQVQHRIRNSSSDDLFQLVPWCGRDFYLCPIGTSGEIVLAVVSKFASQAESDSECRRARQRSLHDERILLFFFATAREQKVCIIWYCVHHRSVECAPNRSLRDALRAGGIEANSRKAGDRLNL
jgi:hypothetical protein